MFPKKNKRENIIHSVFDKYNCQIIKYHDILTNVTRPLKWELI